MSKTKIDNELLPLVEQTTDVVFRIWRSDDELQDQHPSPFALFPGLPGTNDPNTCACFTHCGQHASANYSRCIRDSRPAKTEEYAALRKELESVPYRYQLRIIKRATVRHYSQRTVKP